jgi:hypothetical protein
LLLDVTWSTVFLLGLRIPIERAIGTRHQALLITVLPGLAVLFLASSLVQAGMDYLAAGVYSIQAIE